MLNSVSVILPPLLQWQRFAAILNNLGSVSPSNVAGEYRSNVRGFLFQRQGHRDQAPRNGASPGLLAAFDSLLASIGMN